jgi:hypothetical protein
MNRKLTIGSMIAAGLISVLLVSECNKSDTSTSAISGSNNWAGTWNGTVSCSILSGPLVLQIQPPSGNSLSVKYTFHTVSDTFTATISGDTATYHGTSTEQLIITGNTMSFVKSDCQTATLTRQ